MDLCAIGFRLATTGGSHTVSGTPSYLKRFSEEINELPGKTTIFSKRTLEVAIKSTRDGTLGEIDHTRYR